MKKKTVKKELYFIAVDIGNSRIKYLLDGVQYAYKYHEKWDAVLSDTISKLKNYEIIIGYSTVNRKFFEDFFKKIYHFTNIKIISSDVLLAEQKALKYQHIKGIGTDRVLSLVAAMEEFKPPIITADFGTAVTINAVDQNGTCIGGAIYSGIYSQLKSMAFNTDNLNYIPMAFPEQVSGDTTEKALRSGVIYSCAGGVKEIVDRMCKDYFGGMEVTVILTGGYVDLITPALDNWNVKYYVNKQIVLEGILNLLKIINFDN